MRRWNVQLEPGDDLELQTHFIIYVLSLDREDQACSATQRHTQTHNRLADVGLWVYHPHVRRAHLNWIAAVTCSTLSLSSDKAAHRDLLQLQHLLVFTHSHIKDKRSRAAKGAGLSGNVIPLTIYAQSPAPDLAASVWKLNLHSL